MKLKSLTLKTSITWKHSVKFSYIVILVELALLQQSTVPLNKTINIVFVFYLISFFSIFKTLHKKPHLNLLCFPFQQNSTIKSIIILNFQLPCFQNEEFCVFTNSF